MSPHYLPADPDEVARTAEVRFPADLEPDLSNIKYFVDQQPATKDRFEGAIAAMLEATSPGREAPPAKPPGRGRCRSCQASILWIKSATTGRAIPCDPDQIRIITADGRSEAGYITHFATCPNAAEHRKPREAKE